MISFSLPHVLFSGERVIFSQYAANTDDRVRPHTPICSFSGLLLCWQGVKNVFSSMTSSFSKNDFTLILLVNVLRVEDDDDEKMLYGNHLSLKQSKNHRHLHYRWMVSIQLLCICSEWNNSQINYMPFALTLFLLFVFTNLVVGLSNMRRKNI